jgi:hypothetical protein
MSNDIPPLNKEQIDQILKAFNNQNTLLNSDSYDCLWDNNDSNRTTGRTTRLVDYYIQELFNNHNMQPWSYGYNCGCCDGFITTRAFTTQTCEECEKEFNHPNGTIVLLCNRCSFNLEECKYCKEDISVFLNESSNK